MTIYNGGVFDLASIVGKLPFTTTGIPVELHLLGHSFAGPGTKALYRLGLPENTQHIPLTVNPQEWSKPIGYLDEQAMYHNIAYFNAERNPNFTKEQILDEKHKADERMLAPIAKYEPNGLIDRFHKFVIEKAIRFKLHFGLGIQGAIDSRSSERFASPKPLGIQGAPKPLGIQGAPKPLGFTEDQQEQIAKELHSPIRHKFSRRKVIVNHIDEILACDLMDFS